MSEIASFVNAASAEQALRGRRICMIGGRVMGMYTTMADIIQLKQVFGVEVEHMDAVRLYLAAQNVPSDEVSKTKAWIEENLGAIVTPDDVLERSIRLYIAMRNALSEEGYTIAAVKCQDEMINSYASSCLAVSLLNDQGVTVSCETDLYAALTMNILSSLSDGIALFGDVNHLDMESKVLRVVNCGSMPTSMAESRKDVELGPQYAYMGKAGGATTVLVVKESPVTIARLSRVRGRFVMLAAEGVTQRVDRGKLKEAREYWPQAFIRLKGDVEKLVGNLRSNHMHLCFGHHLKDLQELCRMKDIELLTI
jgi:L-fucose isomerase